MSDRFLLQFVTGVAARAVTTQLVDTGWVQLYDGAIWMVDGARVGGSFSALTDPRRGGWTWKS